MNSSRLRLPLFITGILILALVLWRQWQLAHWQESGAPARAAPRRLAPRFELADQHRKIVKFERFLGRQRVVLLFLDPDVALEDDPLLQRLRECFDVISGAGIKVVAVTTASPFAINQAVEKMGGEIPFPVLADISPTPPDLQVHRMWGRIEDTVAKPLPGLFLVARDGTIPVDQAGRPMPVEDETAALGALCQGEWPR